MSYSVYAFISGNSFSKTKHEFEQGTYLIGSDPVCHISFPDKEQGILPKHAKLIIDNHSILVEALDDNGKIHVDGKGKTSHMIFSEDKFDIGTVTFHFCISNSESEESLPEDSSLSANLSKINQLSHEIFEEIGHSIVGQKDVIKTIWATFLSQGHSLLIGVPGLAKTYMVNTYSKVLGLSFDRIQFTPDLMPSDITGSTLIQLDEDGHRHFEFNKGPLFTQLLLADEINRTPPKTQAALLEAMQERQVTVSKNTLKLPDPFCVIATQNPIEQEGTYPLPEAQKDRFMTCIHLDYPERYNEIEILLTTASNDTPAVRKKISYDEILNFQKVVNKIAISHEIAEYTVDIVRATRPDAADSPEFVKNMVEYGAGPRAGQAILRIAKALAAIDGRPSICKEDIDESALPCLRHRILCNYKAKIENLDEDKIIIKILDSVRCKTT